jgi:type III secretion protein J
VSFLFLAGCQVELHRSVLERDANIMISILQHHNIDAYKEESQPEGYYSIHVGENEFSKAVELLSVQGYPRRSHKNLGELFEPSGLVPTQFEEQVRYVYGLSEELSHTIALFDGVVDTRVHIALPATNAKKERGRASVYIKYDQNIDFDSLIPQIKKLVSDSIGNITYKNVEVLAVPAYFHKGNKQILTAYKFPAGIRVLPEYYSFFIAFCVAIFLIIAQLGVASFWFFKQWKKSEAKTLPTPEEKQQALVEVSEVRNE